VFHFNINVDNVFNVATTTIYMPFRNVLAVTVSEDQILSGDCQLESLPGNVPNKAYGLASRFFPPISVRLGLPFSF
jgi:hypothetical protein